jgi:HSP20 family molecular chaperone IbpA
MEINYGEFERVLMLPDCADTETIKAELKENEGFLYIRIKINKQAGKGD